MKEEVDKVLRGMKNGKSPGEVVLTTDMFKWGDEKMIDKLSNFF